jgi:hypothetical protein
LLAVYRTGGYKNHPFNADIPHGFHQTDRAADVYLVVLARIQDRFLDGDAGCQVVYAIHILKERPEFGTVLHVSPGKKNGRGYTLGISCGEIIQSAHLMPGFDKCIG